MRPATVLLVLLFAGAMPAGESPPGEIDRLTITGDVLHANTLEFGPLTVRDVVAKPVKHGSELRFTECSAKAYGGQVTGTVGVILKSGGAVEAYWTRIELKGADLASILKQAGGNPENLSGSVSGRIELNLPAGRSDLMRGQGEMHITNASLVQLPLLATLIAGDPWAQRGQDEFHAAFELADSKLQLGRTWVSSPSVRIAMRGTISFEGNLNLVLVPDFRFKGVDQAPLVGPLVAPILAKGISKLTTSVVRGHVTRPILVVDPFVRE